MSLDFARPKRGKLFEIHRTILAMSKLTEFLLDLAADPDRCARFKADPTSVLGYTDLNDAEKAAVASRNPQIISAAISNVDPESVILFHWLFSLFSEARP